MRGTWSHWHMGECALPSASNDASMFGFGMRVYTASLLGLKETTPMMDACYHYANRPLLLGRARPIVRCSRLNTGNVLGEVYVPDPLCGRCRGTADCAETGDATDDPRVSGKMAFEDDPEHLRSVALGDVGNDLGDFGVTSRLRAEVRLGWPLAGYERCHGEECREQQEISMLEWMNQHLIPKLAELTGAAAEGVRVSFDFGPYVEATEKAEVVGSDLTLAALPLPLGFIYLFLYTDSLFLSSLAALEIALAWPCALFLYRYIFGFHHFEELTLLASPLTAPFSLEAVSLLIDAWRASASQKAHVVSSLSARLSWTLRDAGFASSHSILVGMAGFASCAISPWLPIAHFGTFCTLILAVQLLLALTFLPACLVIYHEWFETRTNLCCICCVPATTLPARCSPLGSDRYALASSPQTTTERYRDSREIEASIGAEVDTNAMPSSRIWPFPRMLARLILPPSARAATARVHCVPVGGPCAHLCERLQRIHGRHSAWALAGAPPLLATRRALDRSFDISSSEDTVRATLLWGANGVLTKAPIGPSNSCATPASAAVSTGAMSSRLTRPPRRTSSTLAARFVSSHGCNATRNGRTRVLMVGCSVSSTTSSNGSPSVSLERCLTLAQASLCLQSKDPALALSTFLSSSTGVLWQPYIGTIGSAASGLSYASSPCPQIDAASFRQSL